MPQTAKPSVVTNRIQYIAQKHKATLGLRWIQYGNDITIPHTPALVIEPASHKRELINTSMQIMHTFEVALFIYSSGFDGNQAIQKDCDLIAEALIKIVDQDAIGVSMGGTQLDGAVIHGHCSDITYGYSRADDRTMRANRVVFTAVSKTGILD